MEEQVLLQIINDIRRFLDKNKVYEAKQYVQLELNNIRGITPENCKNTKYHFYPTYCKYCSIVRCPDNRNEDLKK